METGNSCLSNYSPNGKTASLVDDHPTQALTAASASCFIPAENLLIRGEIKKSSIYRKHCLVTLTDPTTGQTKGTSERIPPSLTERSN